MKELKQILVVNDYAVVNGGISRVALDSAKALADRGIEVTFFSAVPRPGHQSPPPGIRMESTSQREFLGDPKRFRALARAYWNRAAARAIERLAGSLDPDHSVVHVHSWAQANSASIFAPLLRKKVPLVVTLHDYFIACPIGAFTIFPRNQTCQLRPLSAACLRMNCDLRSRFHKLFKFGRQWVQSKIAKAPGGIRNFIFVSKFSGEILRKHLPPDSRSFVVPNPVDVPKTQPANVRDNGPWVFAGRISPEKGALIFAEAAARLKLDAIFIGDGEEAKTVRRIYPAAKMLGWMDRDSLIATLKNCRGLVFPSVWLETNPISVTEAQALGLPVVVSSGNAATDAVVDGESGLVFRNNDVDDLTAKLLQLETQAELRERMGRRAFERYWSGPATLEKHVDRLLEIYRAAE